MSCYYCSSEVYVFKLPAYVITAYTYLCVTYQCVIQYFTLLCSDLLLIYIVPLP